MNGPSAVRWDSNKIQQYLPHRPPMLLLDEIVEWHEDRIVARKQFRPDEFFFAGHYPGFPLVPGVLLCESALQAGALLLARRGAVADGSRLPVVTRLSNVRFKKIVRPGDVATITAVFKEQLSTAYYLTGKVECNGDLAAWLEFNCTFVEREQA